MDKQRKKQLKKEYLRKELLKQAESENNILADFAKLKLKVPLEKLDIKKLMKLSDMDLEEKIFLKIQERFVAKQMKEKAGDTRLALNCLTKELQTFYFLYRLDSSLVIDGFEMYYLNTTGEDILETIESAKKIGFHKLVDLLEKSLGIFLLIIESGFKYWSGSIDQWIEKSKRLDQEHFKRKAKGFDFDKLDVLYSKLENDFRLMRINYIKQNIAMFQL